MQASAGNKATEIAKYVFGMLFVLMFWGGISVAPAHAVSISKYSVTTSSTVSFKYNVPASEVSLYSNIDVEFSGFNGDLWIDSEKTIEFIRDANQKQVDFEAKFSGDKLTIAPKERLEIGKKYRIIFPPGVIVATEADGITSSKNSEQSITFDTVPSFATSLISFNNINEMLKSGKTAFSKINVMLPERYLTKADVYNTVTSEFSAANFINIDLTAKTGVKTVLVTFNANSSKFQDGFVDPVGASELGATIEAKKSGNIYNAGYIGHNVSNDIYITCKDSEGRIIEQKPLNRISADETMNGKKQDGIDKPVALNTSYTLYNLITKKSQFDAILDEYSLDELYLQYK